MFFDEKEVRADVVLCSKYHTGKKIEFEKDSFIFEYISVLLTRVLLPQNIPHRSFFEQNALFYTIPPNFKSTNEFSMISFCRDVMLCLYPIMLTIFLFWLS
jgi:hypothetical protein